MQEDTCTAGADMSIKTPERVLTPREQQTPWKLRPRKERRLVNGEGPSF